jgi:cytochrome c oxidase cbb3-type subunit I/II
VYSYDCLLFTFGLDFIYIWAHTIYYILALPNWAQNLGVAFSIMLIAPSWGGMINGLLTRGVWDKVSVEPVLNFCGSNYGYGMATFEGPMLSLKNVAIALYRLDYCSRSRRSSTWNGFMAFGMFGWFLE